MGTGNDVDMPKGSSASDPLVRLSSPAVGNDRLGELGGLASS